MYDVLETVSDQPLLVEAEFTLFKTEDGGRHTPFTKNFRPNHNFDWPENNRFFIGQVEMNEGEWMYPGETKILTIAFLDAKGLRELLTEGRRWKIQEGLHVIGEAVVKYVVESDTND